MFNINKQHRAEDDLLDIWLHTDRNWGAEQADNYLDDLSTAIERLWHHPKLGRECDYIRNGYRCLNAMHYRVYYYLTDSSIEIVRVLHERTDEDYQFEAD